MGANVVPCQILGGGGANVGRANVREGGGKCRGLLLRIAVKFDEGSHSLTIFGNFIAKS